MIRLIIRIIRVVKNINYFYILKQVQDSSVPTLFIAEFIVLYLYVNTLQYNTYDKSN